SDKILWISGNAHAAKTANYFPLSDEPCEHIPTVAMWLDRHYGLESVYTLPFSGTFQYQRDGKLNLNPFVVGSSVFSSLISKPFTGLQSSGTLPLSSIFSRSY